MYNKTLFNKLKDEIILNKSKTMKLKTKITYKDIMGFFPCYDPKEIGMPENYEASILNFINEYKDKIGSQSDIIWLLCREQYMTVKDMRLFAVWCAKEALKLTDNPDQRSINACDVAERFANGEATDEELAAAKEAAEAAIWEAKATEAAAWAAAWASGAVARTTWVAGIAGAAARVVWAPAPAAAAKTTRAAIRAAQLNQLKTYFK